ncbi:MAG: hypothetical protein LBT98_03890 [Puniceicoccales bacterium]|jgi:hypothetical protein|nr:hypothetical protein [Puniceicoccales bacterium]
MLAASQSQPKYKIYRRTSQNFPLLPLTFFKKPSHTALALSQAASGTAPTAGDGIQAASILAKRHVLPPTAWQIEKISRVDPLNFPL